MGSNVAESRYQHTAVWTGNDMIVNEMDKVIDLIQEDDGDKMSDDR